MSRTEVEVDFVWAPDCPNVQAARTQLRAALSQAGLPPRWREWDTSGPQTPAALRRHGSPAILVNGVDVDGGAGDASCCRLYENPGARGVPPLESIIRALRPEDAGCEAARDIPAQATGKQGAARWRWAALPAIGLALLPQVFCPACWPAYASALAALGVGFVDYTPWLLPGTALFLALALAALAAQARQRGWAGFWLGLAGGALLLLGKFQFENEVVLWAGIALLAAAFWLPARRGAGTQSNCGSCCPTGN